MLDNVIRDGKILRFDQLRRSDIFLILPVAAGDGHSVENAVVKARIGVGPSARAARRAGVDPARCGITVHARQNAVIPVIRTENGKHRGFRISLLIIQSLCGITPVDLRGICRGIGIGIGKVHRRAGAVRKKQIPAVLRVAAQKIGRHRNAVDAFGAIFADLVRQHTNLEAVVLQPVLDRNDELLVLAGKIVVDAHPSIIQPGNGEGFPLHTGKIAANGGINIQITVIAHNELGTQIVQRCCRCEFILLRVFRIRGKHRIACPVQHGNIAGLRVDGKRVLLAARCLRAFRKRRLRHGRRRTGAQKRTDKQRQHHNFFSHRRHLLSNSVMIVFANVTICWEMEKPSSTRNAMMTIMPNDSSTEPIVLRTVN